MYIILNEFIFKIHPPTHREELTQCVKTVRSRQNSSSLVGISVPEMVDLVSDEVQLSKAKAESVKMMNVSSYFFNFWKFVSLFRT